MPVDKVNTTPGVIKSTETREEINRTAQGWLKNRREDNARREKWLFGQEKVYKEPHSPSKVNSATSTDMSPISHFFRGR
jgi:hypothetical protein